MLDEVGKTKTLPPDSVLDQPIKVKVIMVIKAPRGECQIFERDNRRVNYLDTQCQAIKAFMEQNNA